MTPPLILGDRLIPMLYRHPLVVFPHCSMEFRIFKQPVVVPHKIYCGNFKDVFGEVFRILEYPILGAHFIYSGCFNGLKL